IMPDLNVIDGVAPYNPGAMGSSWDNPEVPATGAPVDAHTPTPEMVPLPTMVPSPTNVTVAKKEAFLEGGATADPYNGYVEQPVLVDIKTPVDAQMSKWNQFGPCD